MHLLNNPFVDTISPDVFSRHMGGRRIFCLSQAVPIIVIIGTVFSSMWYIIGRVGSIISPKTAPIIQLDR